MFSSSQAEQIGALVWTKGYCFGTGSTVKTGPLSANRSLAKVLSKLGIGSCLSSGPDSKVPKYLLNPLIKNKRALVLPFLTRQMKIQKEQARIHPNKETILIYKAHRTSSIS